MACVVHKVIEVAAAPVFREGRPHRGGERGQGGNVGDIQLKSDGFAAERLNLGDNCPGLLFSVSVGQNDIAATPGDAEGGIAAEAAAGTGDE